MRVEPPADVEEPVTIHLLDHGRHTSLVLPSERGAVRYTFGDWRWYAEHEVGPWRAFRALLTPSAATLGRYELSGRDSDEALSRLYIGVQHHHRLEVERAAVEELRADLDRRHAEAERHLFSPRYQLEFASHPEPYHLFNNSNGKVAGWLETLGCAVSGVPLRADWRLDTDPR